MSTNKLQLPVLGFPHGLNTEATVLNVLPTELMEGSINCELFLNGDARRRRGIDFIGSSTTGGFLQTLRASTPASETSMESPAAKSFKLTAPNGDIVERTIVDWNNKFYVYETSSSALSNPDTPFQTIDRGIQSPNRQKFVTMQYATSGDRLFFTGLHCHPGFLKVGADNITLELTYLNVMIRDPAAAAEGTIKKNLLASGITAWFQCIESHTSDATNEPGDGTGDWETYWSRKTGTIPTAVGAWASGQAYTSTIIKQYNKTAASSDSDFHPSTIEFFAGRLWLAGDPRNPNDVYFSQVKVNDEDLEKFFQEADPFSEADPDLVADDGGVISLQGAGLVKKLDRLSESLMIGTNTSIWQVSGSSGAFSATNFSVSEVLSDGIDGSYNMTKTGKELIIFGQSDVWRAKAEESLSLSSVGNAIFTSISDRKIGKLYKAITSANKAAAVALYNSTDHRVYYFYNSGVNTFISQFGSFEQPGYFTNALILDARFGDSTISAKDVEDPANKRKDTGGAWFPVYTFPDTGNNGSPYIAFPFLADNVSAASETVVTEAGDTVIDGSGNTVLATGNAHTNYTVVFCVGARSTAGGVTTIKHAFGTTNGPTTKDWSLDATFTASFDSLLRSGTYTLNDILHNKSATYIACYFNKVETGVLDDDGVDTNPGGCFIRTPYNFAENSASNKYGTARQVYFPDRYAYALAGVGLDGHSTTWYKHRVRGRGRAFGIEFSNDGDKDFHLLGFATQFYAKTD